MYVIGSVVVVVVVVVVRREGVWCVSEISSCHFEKLPYT